MTRSKVLIGALMVLTAVTLGVWTSTVQPQADSFQASSPSPSAKATNYALAAYRGRLEKSAAKYQKTAPYLLKGSSYSTLLETADAAVATQLDAAVTAGESITVQGYEKAEDGYVVIVTVKVGA